jgi:hypothetical protein
VLPILTLVLLLILGVGLGWLIYKLKPQKVRFSARCTKLLELELEMTSSPPDDGEPETMSGPADEVVDA